MAFAKLEIFETFKYHLMSHQQSLHICHALQNFASTLHSYSLIILMGFKLSFQRIPTKIINSLKFSTSLLEGNQLVWSIFYLVTQFQSKKHGNIFSFSKRRNLFDFIFNYNVIQHIRIIRIKTYTLSNTKINVKFKIKVWQDFSF